MGITEKGSNMVAPFFYRRFLPLDVRMYAFGSENGNFCSKEIPLFGFL